MSFLSTNFAAIYVAFFASILAWLFGGLRGDVLQPVMPWLLAMLAEVVFFFPMRHHTENSVDARERTWKAMRRDPVVWVSLALLIVLAVPFVNNGPCPICDAKAIAAGLRKTPLKWAPYCLNVSHHLSVFYWFAGAVLSVLAVRHALTEKGRRLALEMIVWNGVALAAFGFVEAATGAKGPFWMPLVSVWNTGVFFFSTFGYPNVGGDYFTTLFCLAVALWRRRLKDVAPVIASDKNKGRSRHTIFWKRNVHIIPIVILFFAALNTLSRAAIVLVTIAAIVFAAHAFIALLAKHSRAKRIRRGTWSIIVIGLIVFFAITFMPKNIQREVGTLNSYDVLDRLTGKGVAGMKIACDIWRENPFFGCGGWGYAHLLPYKAEKYKLDTKFNQGGANVHNDFLQFLTEHGLVGFGLMVTIAVLLLMPVFSKWRRLVKIGRFAKKPDRPPPPVQIFALPAPAFCLLTALLFTTIHSFADCPLRSAAVLVLFFIVMASIDGAYMPDMPEEEKKADPKGDKKERKKHHHVMR